MMNSMNNETLSMEVASNSPTVESCVLFRSNDIEMEFINIIFYSKWFFNLTKQKNCKGSATKYLRQENIKKIMNPAPELNLILEFFIEI